MQRRDCLKAMAGVSATGIVGVSGCTGDDGTTNIDLAHGPSGGVSTDGLIALQRAVDQKSENINLRLQENSGDPPSVHQFNNEENEGYVSGLDTVLRASDDREPFEDSVERIPSQVFTIAALNLYWVATEDSGIETFDDIVNEDVNFFMLPAGWGTRRMVEEMMENAGVWEDMEDNVVNIELSEVPGAIEEGRLDAVLVYGANWNDIPGWVTEIDARNDVYAVEGTDTLQEAFDSYDASQHEEIEVRGWDQDLGADTIPSAPVPYNLFIGDDVPDEAVYEVCRISHEHVDVVREAFDPYPDHSDGENMAFALSDGLDIHPGAVEFYEEYNIDF